MAYLQYSKGKKLLWCLCSLPSISGAICREDGDTKSDTFTGSLVFISHAARSTMTCWGPPTRLSLWSGGSDG